MSDTEKFAARWSRLKRQTTRDKNAAETPRADPAHGDGPTDAPARQTSQAAPAEAGPPQEPAFDVASLPSIESIAAGSDIRAFLQSGVPAELTKAALRRAWTTDPAIRDFIGIAENQWDFTDPTATPGFGPLEATDDVRQLVAQAMGELGKVAEPSAEATAAQPAHDAAAQTAGRLPSQVQELAQVSGMPDGNAADQNPRHSAEEQSSEVFAAPPHADAPAEDRIKPSRRAHGSALPH